MQQHVLVPRGLGDLAQFDEAKLLLSKAEQQIELCYACGAILMMEKVFADYSELAAIEYRGDYEGWHIGKAMMRLADGKLEWSNTVVVCLHQAKEEASGEKVDPIWRPSPDSARAARERWIAESFKSADMERIHAMDNAVEEALALFNRHARSLFYESCMDEARVLPGSAEQIAEALGLSQVASAISMSRLEKSLPLAPKKGPRPGL